MTPANSNVIRKIDKTMELLSKQRKAKLEAYISLEHLVHNFNTVRAVTDSRICCVIKADAYGHGAWQCARTLAAAGADFFAVSSIAEAEEVRLALADYGDKIGILILGYTLPAEADLLIKQLRKELSELLTSADQTKKFLTFSAGICSYPTSASTSRQMLTNANMAVDAAKKSGKNKTVIYTHQDSAVKSDLSVQNIETIGQEYASTIYALTAAIDAKDHYTFSHSKNVSYLATQLAQATGLDGEHVEMIRQAGLLHDIGKISIPESILTKNGRLTNEEYDIMKGHAANSISRIRHLPSLDYVIPIAISHHERYDGGGYPHGLAGENIPLGGRYLAVADAFDAMVSKRPYKEARPISDALEEIERNLGKQFDPEIGRKFVDLIRDNTIKTDCYD